jgi:hypothetical protein
MTEQSTYNAGDEGQVARAQQKQKTREILKRSALRKIMSDAEGRIWMWDLLTMSGLYHSSFSTDALAMAFTEGHRNIGLRIMAEINRISPELYARMVAENQPKEKASD